MVNQSTVSRQYAQTAAAGQTVEENQAAICAHLGPEDEADISNNEEDDTSSTIKLTPEQRQVDQYYKKLESTMVDNGWQLKTDENENPSEYFIHPTYKGQRATIFTYTTYDGDVMKLPIIGYMHDPKGLGCTVTVYLNGTHLKVISNEWTHSKNTRRSRRNRKNRGKSDRRKKDQKMFKQMQENDKKKREINYGLKF